MTIAHDQGAQLHFVFINSNAFADMSVQRPKAPENPVPLRAMASDQVVSLACLIDLRFRQQTDGRAGSRANHRVCLQLHVFVERAVRLDVQLLQDALIGADGFIGGDFAVGDQAPEVDECEWVFGTVDLAVAWATRVLYSLVSLSSFEVSWVVVSNFLHGISRYRKLPLLCASHCAVSVQIDEGRQDCPPGSALTRQ
jgi:hypothetical protein